MPPAGFIDEDRSNGPLRNLYVLLSGGRLYLAIGWDGQSRDTLKEFAQASVAGSSRSI
jgi:hypothetical protein